MGSDDTTTSFSYYTVTAPITYHLRLEERVFLTIFEVLSTILTILLNLYLLYMIIVKVRVTQFSCSC